MRPVVLVSLVACLAVGIAAFLFGRNEGQRQAELVYRATATNLNAQTSAASFFAATRAVELLN